jgi:hypothetical protein
MDVVDPDVVSIGRAAELLDMTTREVVDLVFTRQLKSVPAPSGRRLVPLSAIEGWKKQHTSAAT